MEKIRKNVEITESGCWLWKKCIITSGYGQIKYDGKKYPVHRLHWILSGRTIPEGYIIRHKCRNRHCCSLDHLETGTHSENMLDKHRDGTMMVKLTEDQVRQILNSEKRNIDLAKEFGVKQNTISQIKTRRRWRWLEI